MTVWRQEILWTWLPDAVRSLLPSVWWAYLFFSLLVQNQMRMDCGIPAVQKPIYRVAVLLVKFLQTFVLVPGEFIIGRVIKAMNNSWHPECFCCDLCQAVLADVGFVKNAGRSVLLLSLVFIYTSCDIVHWHGFLGLKTWIKLQQCLYKYVPSALHII